MSDEKKIITGITVKEQMRRAKEILEIDVIPKEKKYADMKIREEMQIDLTPSDVEKIIREHFKDKYELETIHFNIDGVEDPSDWRAEYPLSYQMTKVNCTGTKVK